MLRSWESYQSEQQQQKPVRSSSDNNNNINPTNLSIMQSQSNSPQLSNRQSSNLLQPVPGSILTSGNKRLSNVSSSGDVRKVDRNYNLSEGNLNNVYRESGVMDEELLYKYKTAMCKSGRDCRYGSGCNYAHDRSELRRNLKYTHYFPIQCNKVNCSDDTCKYSHTENERIYHPDTYKTRQCKDYRVGDNNSCPRGNYCSFAHGRKELREGGHTAADKLQEAIAANNNNNNNTNTGSNTTGNNRRMNQRYNRNQSRLTTIQQQVRRASLASTKSIASEGSISSGSTAENNIITTTTTTNIANKIEPGEVENVEELKLIGDQVHSLVDSIIQSKIKPQTKGVNSDLFEDIDLRLELFEGNMEQLQRLPLDVAIELFNKQKSAIASTEYVINQLKQQQNKYGPINKLKCRICNARDIDIVIYPCAHHLICSECRNNSSINKCPDDNCNAVIENTDKILFELPYEYTPDNVKDKNVDNNGDNNNATNINNEIGENEAENQTSP